MPTEFSVELHAMLVVEESTGRRVVSFSRVILMPFPPYPGLNLSSEMYLEDTIEKVTWVDRSDEPEKGFYCRMKDPKLNSVHRTVEEVIDFYIGRGWKAEEDR